MKNQIFYSFVLILLVFSTNTFAEWVIAGNQCRSVLNSGGALEYSYSDVTNIGDSNEWVVCLSPVVNSYGKKLQIDVFVVNNSSHDLLCLAYTEDESHNVIDTSDAYHIEYTGWDGATLKLSPPIKENADIVYVGAFCRLPPKERPESNPSSIISIRFY